MPTPGQRLAARLYHRLGRVPTGGIGHARRRVRLLCVLAVRDDRRFLEGFFDNVAPHVDGIVACDDGSTDGSAELLERQPAVLELLRNPPGRERWDEVGDFKALVAAAHRHGAEWIVSLDADHRVERRFRDRTERAIRRARLAGMSALSFHVRELWDSPDRYRVDGIWGDKRRVALWAARPDHVFDERELHALKVPMQARWGGLWPLADLEVYHLRMVEPEDRRARRRRYQELDPDEAYQPGIGYAYLTDERGLQLQPVPRRRGYRR